jgi:hypothetical protein
MEKPSTPKAGMQTGQGSFLHAFRLDLTTGLEALSSWINHIEAKGGIETLFELEAWLRGLQAFSNVVNLPPGDGDRAPVIFRNFSPEIRVLRLALMECEQCAIRLCHLGRDANMDLLPQLENQIYKLGVRNTQVGRMLEQYAPTESLAVLVEDIQDLSVMADALNDTARHEYRTFVSLGRMLQRSVYNSRHVGIFLNQRFRIQFDRRDTPALRSVLQSITDETLRRNVSLSLLYFYRNLKYLRMIASALRDDRPLRRYLVIFALLREQTGILSDFLRTRFLRDKQGNARLREAVDLIVHSLHADLERTFKHELPDLMTEADAAVIYERVENSHGLLLNCYQYSVTALVQALDETVDGGAIFPEMLAGLQNGQNLRKDLWDLRLYLKSELEKSGGLDLSHVLDRIARFRESSLRHLMYRDWGEFESLTEFLIMAGNEMEVRVLLRRFVSFLEILMQEVSNRSVLRKSAGDPGTRHAAPDGLRTDSR